MRLRAGVRRVVLVGCVGVVASVRLFGTAASRDTGRVRFAAAPGRSVHLQRSASSRRADVERGARLQLDNPARNRVQVSVEGATNARATIANAGTGDVSVQTDGVLSSDIWSRGNVLFLASNTTVARIDHDRRHRHSADQRDHRRPQVLEHQSLTAVPTSWSITFPSSTTNVQLQPGQTRTLTPGGYATVSVASNATLTLQSGTYYFDAAVRNEPFGQDCVHRFGAVPPLRRERRSHWPRDRFSFRRVRPGDVAGRRCRYGRRLHSDAVRRDARRAGRERHARRRSAPPAITGRFSANR